MDEAVAPTAERTVVPSDQPVMGGFVIRPLAYQVAQMEPLVSFVVGGGTSAVLLRGSTLVPPPGAVLVVPSGSPVLPSQ
jgi:hypothetical protein